MKRRSETGMRNGSDQFLIRCQRSLLLVSYPCRQLIWLDAKLLSNTAASFQVVDGFDNITANGKDVHGLSQTHFQYLLRSDFEQLSVLW